jgi:tRNA(Ile)-lysidine synthase
MALWERVADALPSPDAQPATIIVAVSGGADSVALLLLLDEVSQQLQDTWRLHVAHVNHALRGPDSDGDARFVQTLAEQMGSPCTVESQPVSSSSGIEAAARDARYAFFERITNELGAPFVATGHHADDQAETILHRILRGTGVRGLAGIPARRRLARGSAAHLIRPLLTLTRQDLRDYLEVRGQLFREDDSNRDPGFTRNRTRHELIPLLESSYNPAVRTALCRLGEQSRSMQEWIDEVIERRFPNTATVISTDEVTLSCKALLKETRFLRFEIVRRAIEVIGARQRRLGHAHFVEIVDFAGRDVSGKTLEMPDGLRVARRRDALTFTHIAR